VTSTSTAQVPTSTLLSFTSASIAPETFTDWDPVSQTTTYSSVSSAESSFTTAVVAPETFSDWDPVSETATYVGEAHPQLWR
jgi:hypothetical protein